MRHETVTAMPTPVIDWDEIHRLHNERCDRTMAEFYHKLAGPILTENGFPADELWLVECQTAQDAREFYGAHSAMAQIIGADPYVIYYHESGNLYGIHPFRNLDTLKAACQQLACEHVIQ